MDKLANEEIRERIRLVRLRHYEVAVALGVGESTFVRMLRQDLPEEKRERVLAVIEQLAEKQREVTV